MNAVKPYVRLFARRWLLYFGITVLFIPWLLILEPDDLSDATVRGVVGVAYLAALFAAFDVWGAVHRERPDST